MDNSILFGNGLNSLSKNSLPWTDLLTKIKGKVLFDNGLLPNTMIYERALLENKSRLDIKTIELQIKNEIAEILRRMEPNKFYQMLFDLKCKNYLTTNYDYAFRETILKNDSYRSYNNSSEDIYSIRRYTSIHNEFQKELCKIWHIHGEIDKPISIMLGLDHYCGSVSKLDSYIKGNYEFQENNEPIKVKTLVNKLTKNVYDNRSWAELFFNSNIHILGFSLDYSETDLWWMLTRRARTLSEERTAAFVKNKIYFYTTNLKPEKEGLLKSLNITVVKPQNDVYESDWPKYYIDTLDQIEKNF